ncbi:hypothetical protein EDB19DRAFT_2042758 [Suillus lakei]|nr:hypothetical protein EDB19DRAFT_2042758 [Suillus lakei]
MFPPPSSSTSLNLVANNCAPISERMQPLRDKAHARFRVDIHSSKTVSIPEELYYGDKFIVDGHLYLWDEITRRPRLFQYFQSPHNKQSSVTGFQERCVQFPTQPTSVALDDDRFHPQAAGPTLFLLELPGYENSMDSDSVKLKGFGRHIALQHASSQYDMWKLQIWDWQHSTTSNSVLSDEYPHEIDFCFIGNNRLVVVADYLKLYSIEDMSQAPELLARFVLPVQLPVDGIACSSQPQMQAQPTMYTSDPKHRLLCITTSMYLCIVYIISTRIFFDLDEMAVAMPIPWKCWGPSNTRIFRYPLAHTDKCKVHISGNRVLPSLPVHTPISNRTLRIMDFSPLAVTNRRGLGRVVREPSTLKITDPVCKFNGPEECLTTSLPYVEVVLDRKFRLDNLEDIWIDKDRIYLLSDKLEVIDV